MSNMQEDRSRLRYLTQRLSTNVLTIQERAELHNLLLAIDVVPIRRFSRETTTPAP